MKYPKLRELKEAIKALIMGPYTSSFPFKPHVPPKQFRGRPKYDDKECIGCLACENVCPAGAIDHEEIKRGDKQIRHITTHHDQCIFCGHCQVNCTTEKGIMLSNEFDLATFDRKDSFHDVEKELALCECCGEVVACQDHLVWISKRLGSLSFSNPTIYLAHLKQLGVVDENIQAAAEAMSRGDRMKILCVECRRKASLEK
ncbi:MAG: 4Fe-4S dicluster domain-containing protein [Candidatus Omnitrophica bacterium]|nr:4Fe-4S dicluster domain-containing protein [Candidatus Omnitrophota bacterium]